MNRIPVSYPLNWPAGKTRTSDWDRMGSVYKKNGRNVTLAESQTRLYLSLDKFNNQGKGFVVNTDDADLCELRTMMQLRRDGQFFLSDQKTPPDAGAVVYFQIDNSPITIAIDRFVKIEQNIAACAAAIDSLRQLFRVDAGTFLAAASGLNALPAPSVVANPNWRTVLGFDQRYSPTLDEVKHNYRTMAKAAHPDSGGTKQTMAALNIAYSEAKTELRGTE